MNEHRRTLDPEFLDILIVTAFVLVVCVQILVILALIFSFIPQPLNDFAKTIYSNHQGGVHPEREMLLYRLFVFMALICQGIAIYVWLKWSVKFERKRVLEILAFDVFLLGLQIFAFFKIIVFDDPAWARAILYFALTATIVGKIFWVELRRGALIGWGTLLSKGSLVWLKRVADALMVAFIIGCVYTPHTQQVLARIFVWDQFNKFDAFVMSPAWAALCGVPLNQLWDGGVILPRLISKWAVLFPPLTYSAVLNILIVMSSVYFILVYLLLRRWTSSVMVSAFGVLLLIKLNMFHLGTMPLIWVDPSLSVVRYFPDLIFYWALLEHGRTSSRKYLWWSSLAVGILLAYAPLNGIAVAAAFFIYLLCLIWNADLRRENFSFPRDIQLLVVWVFGPWALAFVILGIFSKGASFQIEFWNVQWQSVQLWFNGFAALPVYDCLKERQFSAYFIGFFIPLLYLFSLAFSFISSIVQKTNKVSLIAAVFAVYGLGLFLGFVHHSSVSYYYVFCVPLIFVLCFWVSEIGAWLTPHFRGVFLGVILMWSFGALSTSYLFTYYPNVFSLSKYDSKSEIVFYQANFDFTEDALLIRKLTRANQEVVLLSSFETEILMEAHRKSFFKIYPFMVSRSTVQPELGGFRIYTRQQLLKWMEKLSVGKPEYVFVEKQLLNPQILAAYLPYQDALKTFIVFLKNDYTLDQQGKYLVVLKRKTGQQ